MPGLLVEAEKKPQDDDPIISDNDDTEDSDDGDDSDDDDGARELTREQLANMQRTLARIERKLDQSKEDILRELEQSKKDIEMMMGNMETKLDMKLSNIERMQAYSIRMGQQSLLFLKAIAKHMGVDITEVLRQLQVFQSASHEPGATPVPTTVVSQPHSSSSSTAPTSVGSSVDAPPASALPDGATTVCVTDPAVVYPAPGFVAPSIVTVAAVVAIPPSET